MVRPKGGRSNKVRIINLDGSNVTATQFVMILIKPSRQKSRMMSRVRTKGTAPELALRSALHSAGLRFRLHRKDLPGKPDIVLPKYKCVIFVHGCFWHQHEGCIKSTMPKTNIEFWQNKIASNVRRDKSNQVDLSTLGWRAFVVWECDIKKDLSGVIKQLVGHIQELKFMDAIAVTETIQTLWGQSDSKKQRRPPG